MNDGLVPTTNFGPIAISAEPVLKSPLPLVLGIFGHAPATSTGGSPLTSSWVQRWKLGEERDCLLQNSSDKDVKSSSSQPLQRVYSKKPHELEALNRSITDGGAIAVKAANGKEKESCLDDISRDTVQKTANLNPEGALNGHGNALVTDTEKATPKLTHRAAAVPSRAGFGPWMNVNSRAKAEDKKVCERDGQGKALPADTDNINIRLTHQGTPVLSNSGIGPPINADFRGRTDDKSELISGHTSSPFKVSPVSNTLMEPVSYRPEVKDGAKSSLTLKSARPSPVGSFGALSVVFGPGSMGQPPLPPPKSGAPSCSKLGLPPRPNSKKVQCSTVSGVRSRPSSLTALSAGGRDALHMPQSHVLAPTHSCSRMDSGLMGNDVNTGTGTKIILDKRFPFSSRNVTDPLVVPQAIMANHVHIEKRIEQRSLTSTVRAFSSAQISSKQYKLASEGQLKKSSIMPPPACIPSAARQCQSASAEQAGFNTSHDKKVGSADCGRLENSEKIPTNIKLVGLNSQSMSDVLQPELPRPLEVSRDSGSLGECKGILQQQSLSKLSYFIPDSELKGSHGIAQSDRAEVGSPELTANVSTTASLPLQTFVEAAGSSKKTREILVEVYNRARDDLKNQRSSLIRGKVPEEETGDSPSSTYRQGACNCDIPSRPMSQIVNGHQLGCLQSLKTRDKHDSKSFGMDVKVINSRTGRVGEVAGSQQLISKSIPRQGAIQSSHEERFQKTGPSGVTCQPGHTSGFNIKGSAFNMYLGSHVEQISPSGKGQHPEHKECLRGGQRLVIEEVKQKEMHSRIPQEQGNVQVYDDGNIDKESKAEEKSTEVTLRSDKFSFSSGLRKELSKFVGSNDSEGGAVFCLGKRNRQTFEESMDINCGTGTMGKHPTEGWERPVITPLIWLQRWYPTAVRRKFMQGFTEPPYDSITKSSSGCSSCVATTSEGTKFNLPNREGVEGNLKGMAEKEHVVEHIRTPSKLLASAAAMAIVGTTSRHFRPAPSQRKGSVATWAAFGTPPLKEL